jgi:PncC family amidohydrolase
MNLLTLHKELEKRQEKIFFAESCTGGEIAARITKIAGASHYFIGSMVVYEDAMKEKILGVKKKTLSDFGAVSREVVEEMANGLFALSDATWVIAVSGIAGPSGGSIEKPVGTIWASVSKRGEKQDIGLIPIEKTLPRREIIEKATDWLLEALLRKITHNIRAFS